MANMMVRLGLGAGSILVLVVGGCASKNAPATLTPQAFYEPRHRVSTLPPQQQASMAQGGVSNGAVANGARNGASAAPTAPAPPPEASLSSGSYMLVGEVIGEVNGQPIYADKVLAKLETALHSKATQTNPKLGPEEYRKVATGLISDQVLEDVNEELFFAAAQRNTSEQDQAMAAGLTTVFRAKEIRRSAGSESMARSSSMKDGIDFDDRMQHEYRRNMVGIYLSKKVWPQVQVTADDRREFYNRNVDTLFTEKAEVKFRAIRVGVREMGSPEAAFDRAKSLHTRAANGEDFAKLATQYNQDRTLSANGGYMFMVEKKDELGQVIKDSRGEPVKEAAYVPRGTLANEELEKVIFELVPGQISEVMKHGESYHIVKLEDRKAGRVRAFEEPDLQEAIRARLTADQRRALQDKEIAKLRNASVLSGAALRNNETYLKHLEPAIEMAMQKYHAWNRAAQSVTVTPR